MRLLTLRGSIIGALCVLMGTIIVVETATVLAKPKKKDLTTRAPAPKLQKPEKVSKKVDSLLNDVWRAEEVKPQRKTSDSAFLRRASLDLAGVIPTEEQTRRFLKSRKSNKRRELIKELMASDTYARTMALRWAYTLVGRDYLIRSKLYKRVQRMRMRRERMMGGMEGMGGEESYGDQDQLMTLNEWLERHFKENTPWDEVSTGLIAAQGTVIENPATHYILKHSRNGKAAEITGSVMRVFQGLQLQCAQCHDDRLNNAYKQETFWGVAAFFARTQARRVPPPGMTRMEAKKNKKLTFQVWDRPFGQIRMPAAPGEQGRLILPEFVTGEIISPSGNINRRAELAKIITSKKNPYFAKATVNRVWAWFFGKGLVEPIDAVDQTDYPLEPVMKLLEADFRASNYDMGRLIKVIVSTRAYELGSAGPDDTREDERALFARAPLRTLSAEQLFYSVLEATGVEDIRTGNRGQRRRLERMKFMMLQKFVRTFSEDEEDEEVEEGTIPQALMRLNGPLTNDAVRARPGHPVYDRLFRMRKLDDRIDTIYLRVLSRFPTNDERKVLRKYLGSKKRAVAAAQAYSDVFWALLNSSEFNLNH